MKHFVVAVAVSLFTARMALADVPSDPTPDPDEDEVRKLVKLGVALALLGLAVFSVWVQSRKTRSPIPA